VVPYYSTYVALSRSWNVAEGPRDSVESTCDTWEDPDARPAPISGAKDLIAFTTTAGRIAALNRAGTGARLRVWDTRSGQLLLEQAVGFAVGNVKIDASDRHVIVTGKSPVVPEMLPLPAAVAIWDIAARRLVLELPEADGTIALDVARDGSRAAAVSNTGELRVWQLAGGQVQRAVLAAPGPVAFSENGRWLAAGGGSIRVLDASTLRPLAQIETGGRVHAIGFRSNGTLLAVRHYEAAAGMMVLDRFRWRTADMLSEACARLPLKAATEQWRQLMPNQAVADPCGGRAAPPRN
jgi:WD40 repeat protein